MFLLCCFFLHYSTKKQCTAQFVRFNSYFCSKRLIVAKAKRRLSCFVNSQFAMLMQLERSNFDSRKTKVTQPIIKKAVSRQYTKCIQAITDVQQAQGVTSEGIVRVVRRNETRILSNILIFHKQSLISWGKKHQMSKHCLLGDQAS